MTTADTPKPNAIEGIFLKNGYTIVESSYGQGVTIDDIDGLHRAIAADILKQKTPMTGHQFRFLRKECAGLFVPGYA